MPNAWTKIHVMEQVVNMIWGEVAGECEYDNPKAHGEDIEERNRRESDG